jgi:hypothetical protein
MSDISITPILGARARMTEHRSTSKLIGQLTLEGLSVVRDASKENAHDYDITGSLRACEICRLHIRFFFLQSGRRRDCLVAGSQFQPES